MSVLIPELVWNRGIAALCKWRVPNEFPNGEYVPWHFPCGDLSAATPDDVIAHPDEYQGVSEGDLVWVRVSWLKAFVRQVLPRIQSRFILVTGDSDSSVPSKVEPYADMLLKDGKLMHWFAQNCEASDVDTRFSRIPIGIDFHTLHYLAIWGEPITPAMMQEAKLKSIANSLSPVQGRRRAVYVDFAWQSQDYGGRPALLRATSSNSSVFLQQAALPRSEMWRRRGEYMFVLSPSGIGMDCHRTWEALALGHIVIVPRMPKQSVYDGLAVVSIDSPSEITKDNLMRWERELAVCTRRTERLTSRWWVECMRRRGRSPQLQSAANGAAGDIPEGKVAQNCS